MTSRTDTASGSRPLANDRDTTATIAVDALGGIGAAAYAWDIASDALSWTPRAEKLLGVGSVAEIASGRRFARFVDPSGPTGRHDAVMGNERVDTGVGVPYEARYRFRPASAGATGALWIEDCGRWFAGADGRPARASGIVRVVNDRQARDEALLFRSEHDELTGALNRTRLVEELDAALAEASRNGGSGALAVIAVDNLGPINDAYGYDVGDELVGGVAKRLEATMRRGDALGRLAGNKIGVVLNACSENDLRIAAERFSAAVGEAPVVTSSGAVAITVSIGAVVLPRHARSTGEALAHAQEALSSARRRGAACILLYEPSPRREADRRSNIALTAKVVDALNAGRVRLALQPVVGIATRRPVFHEALCRLHTEEGEALSPAAFIETAERLGIVRLLDHRALDMALAALSADPGLNLSINVSASSALYGSWFAHLAAHLRRARNIAPRLIVEITETVAIADLDRAVQFVQSLHDLGCRVAIDDFGAGHTSFRNLRALRVDLVKIDGSFVENIADSRDDQVFVAALVQLARHMGLKTAAERVVNEADAVALRKIGVDYLQGHLVGRPALLRQPKAAKTPRRAAV